MSYIRDTTTITGLRDAIANTLYQDKVYIEGLADELTAAAGVVRLETGDLVAVSCVVHDRPETPQIDLMTVAIACDDTGTPRRKANGQVVGYAFWSSLWASALAERGVDTVRKALMMVALGEPQPQVAIPNPDPDGPQTQDAVPMATPEAHSIRSQISTADQLAAPLTDVL